MPARAPGTPHGDGFASRQWNYFHAADGPKFQWQTACPVVATTERQLVSAAAGDGRLLEVGCGE
ncbi:MAG TPA: hypothetical protein VN203_23475, partial [Candidatus Acidoferrum sp.]|nr:hypothetical protein [Candidatus Acidoferrum sp.]